MQPVESLNLEQHHVGEVSIIVNWCFKVDVGKSLVPFPDELFTFFVGTDDAERKQPVRSQTLGVFDRLHDAGIDRADEYDDEVRPKRRDRLLSDTQEALHTHVVAIDPS
ncbi:MAG: hypothetical protein EBZ98_02505, partial [Actinobacteria bacterium]|nr:hypothetical protein [Actinomycetota bacterium]